MRPLLVLLLAVVVLGGMQWFMNSQTPATNQEQPGAQIIAAPGEFNIELLMTFDAGPDEFSLEETDAPSLLVQLGGKEIFRSSEEILGDAPIVISNVEGLRAGGNHIYVEASPKDDQLVYRAVHVRVLRDDTPLMEQTLIADPGALVQGTINVEIAE